MTIQQFIESHNSANPQERRQALNYFFGVQDTLMYMNDWMRYEGYGEHVCFPSPIPDRETMYMEYIGYLGEVAGHIGWEKLSRQHVDQVLWASWRIRYECD
ncbi:hypothetical protein [Halorhodospira sp. 9622]|uniref:hypothetical protein n=1 Tax=Halorhodospira sp. 9622 TaxID=2899136 RepID=UPI001EE7D92B|nr:hypothetical protein [Halorhodospira sp. 9622]MCG5537637.1 hypothetical protein [Halorhodospira sp. 9622]